MKQYFWVIYFEPFTLCKGETNKFCLFKQGMKLFI